MNLRRVLPLVATMRSCTAALVLVSGLTVMSVGCARSGMKDEARLTASGSSGDRLDEQAGQLAIAKESAPADSKAISAHVDAEVESQALLQPVEEHPTEASTVASGPPDAGPIPASTALSRSDRGDSEPAPPRTGGHSLHPLAVDGPQSAAVDGNWLVAWDENDQYESEIAIADGSAVISTRGSDGRLLARYRAQVAIDAGGNVIVDARGAVIDEADYAGWPAGEYWSPDSFAIGSDGSTRMLDNNELLSNGVAIGCADN